MLRIGPQECAVSHDGAPHIAHLAPALPDVEEQRCHRLQLVDGLVERGSLCEMAQLVFAPRMLGEDTRLLDLVRRLASPCPTRREGSGKHQEKNGGARESHARDASTGAGLVRRAPPRTPGVIRLSVNSGEWSIEPVGGGRSLARYRLLTDPGGHVPI